MDNRTMRTIQANPALRVSYALRVTLAVLFLIALFLLLVAVIPVGERTTLWVVFAVTSTVMVIFTILYICSVVCIKPAGAGKREGAGVVGAEWAGAGRSGQERAACAWTDVRSDG